MKPAKRSWIPEEDVDRLIEALHGFHEKVGEALGRLGDLDGWFPAPYDPTELITCFPRLRLRHGIRLAAYQFVSHGNGNAVVYAVPAGREPDSRECAGSKGPVVGPRELGDRRLWLHLEGDGSLASYFESSIFQREAAEVGAMWHGCDWSTHTIIRRHPYKSADLSKAAGGRSLSTSLEWLKEPPFDWRPVVYSSEDGSVLVDFYTYSRFGREGIFLHHDSYSEGFSMVSVVQTIGEGDGGYIL